MPRTYFVPRYSRVTIASSTVQQPRHLERGDQITRLRTWPSLSSLDPPVPTGVVLRVLIAVAIPTCLRVIVVERLFFPSPEIIHSSFPEPVFSPSSRPARPYPRLPPHPHPDIRLCAIPWSGAAVMGASMELHAVNGHGSAGSKNNMDEMAKTPHVSESGLPSADQRDAQALARLGKKPVLKVRDSW